MGKLGYFVQFQLSFHLTSRLSQGISNMRMGVFQCFPPDSMIVWGRLSNFQKRMVCVLCKWLQMVNNKQIRFCLTQLIPGWALTNSQERLGSNSIHNQSKTQWINETCLGVYPVFFYSKKTTKNQPTHPCHQWNPERPLDRPLKKRNSPSLSSTEVRLGTIDFGSASLSEQMLVHSKGPGSFG